MMGVPVETVTFILPSARICQRKACLAAIDHILTWRSYFPVTSLTSLRNVAKFCAKRTPGTCSQRMEVFLQWRWFNPRGVYTPKKWLSIFTFIEWVFSFYLIVFCSWLRSVSAEAPKKRVGSFHYEEQICHVQRDESPYMPLWSKSFISMKRLSDIEPSAFFQGVLSSECSIPYSCLGASEGGKGPSKPDWQPARSCVIVPHTYWRQNLCIRQNKA